MDRLKLPNVGDKITAKWARDIIDEIRRQNIIPGRGLKKQVTSSGTILTLTDDNIGGGGSTSAIDAGQVFIAQVISEPKEDGSIPVDLYNPDSFTVAHHNVLAFRPDLTHFSTMDIGTRFLVHALNVSFIEGSENL